MHSFFQMIAPRLPRRQRGSTLAVVMVVMALLAAFVSAAYSLSSGNTIVVQRASAYTAATGVAEAMMELVYARWRDIVSFIPEGNPATITPNYNARLFIDSSANRLHRDITKVTPDELGLPAEVVNMLGLPQLDTNTPMGTVTIQTVDVYGRRYPEGGYDSDGRCTTPANVRIQPIRPALPSDYPTTADPDYAFTADNAAARGLPGVNIVYEVKVKLPYMARASSGSQKLNVEISRRFTKFYATTAQFAFFFQDRLELTPGASMTINGRVHTNNDLYVYPRGSANLLKFLDSVTYTGAFYEALPAGVANSPKGTVQYASDPDRVDALPVGGISPDALAPPSGTKPNYNNNSLREIIERPVAKSDSAGKDPTTTPYATYYDLPMSGTAVDPRQLPVEEARVYNKAGVKILVTYKSDGTIDKLTVRGRTPEGMADGPDLSVSHPTAVNLVKSALNNVTNTGPNGFRGDQNGSGRRTDVNDLRESTGGSSTVGVTTLDISKFLGANNVDLLKQAYPDFNGVLYVADVTGGGANGSYNDTGGGNYETAADGSRKKHGIMLVNANNLPGVKLDTDDPSRFFTVASDNAVYVKGDFNTGGDPANAYYTDPVTGRQIAKTQTLDPNYDRVSASIMADSVGVVSNRFSPEFANASGVALINSYLMATNASGQPIIDPLTGQQAVVKDSNGNPVLKRGAIETTVNAAVVGGINDKDGAQNLIRFLEKWQNTTGSYVTDPTYGTSYEPGVGSPASFNYLGSIIQIFRPKEFNGAQNNAYYDTAARSIGFDNRFLTRSPVGPSVILIYSRGTLINDARTPYRRL